MFDHNNSILIKLFFQKMYTWLIIARSKGKKLNEINFFFKITNITSNADKCMEFGKNDLLIICKIKSSLILFNDIQQNIPIQTTIIY